MSLSHEDQWRRKQVRRDKPLRLELLHQELSHEDKQRSQDRECLGLSLLYHGHGEIESRLQENKGTNS